MSQTKITIMSIVSAPNPKATPGELNDVADPKRLGRLRGDEFRIGC
jgi:hypothetical protein